MNKSDGERFSWLKKAMTSLPVLSFPYFKQPFVLETEPSVFAEGEVLVLRKEDGHVHPIQFTSRTMRVAERKYASCELEALAVLFGLGQSRLHLLSSKPFLL